VSIYAYVCAHSPLKPYPPPSTPPPPNKTTNYKTNRLHPNAEIDYRTQQGEGLFRALLELQPPSAAAVDSDEMGAGGGLALSPQQVR
jgi:hypothetical protein